MNMNNEIIIRSVYGKVNQIYYINPCPNPKTLRFPECIKPVNFNGDMILSEDDVKDMSSGMKFFVPANHVEEVFDGKRYNLDDIVDNAHWESIKYCPWIAKDRFERDAQGDLIIDGGAKRYGVADLYVERPGEITSARVSKKQLIHRACDYIYQDSESERIKKCRVMGRDLRSAVPADILDFLIDKAEKEPKKIIELYEGDNWKLELFILDAIDKGVIRKSPDGIYTYGDKMLGATSSAVIAFLKDIRYKKISESIRLETYPHLQSKEKVSELEQEQIDSLMGAVDEAADNASVSKIPTIGNREKKK